jgi:hypothetical protein
MAASSTYTYKVLKSSWGIRIALVAEVVPDDGSFLHAIYLGHGVSLAQSIADSRLSAAEIEMLSAGLRSVAVEIANVTAQKPVVVVLNDVQFVESDYQVEGLAAAIIGWATAQFGLEEHDIEVSFNRETNRYDFRWPGAEPG